LKLDDLVFVYFTNFSSPEGKWLSMLAGIRGEHYRVDEQQWRYICEKFEIDGIPSYVLVDRSGSYELRNDLRNHEKMKRTLLQKVSAH
jgi:hypothetical protein